MHPNELEDLLRGDVTSDKRWPPESVSAAWERVKDYRARYTNDPAELFSYRTDLHVAEDPKATAERAQSFTPVPLARDIARFSAQLLFSEPPKVEVEGEPEQGALDALAESNDLPSFLLDAADNIASEGSGGIRIVVDDSVNAGRPILSFEPADTVLWRTHYGRFTEGGVVVLTRERDGAVYRLLESHEPGLIRRRLFKGSHSRLGQSVGLTALAEFRDLRDEQRTGITRPTLIRWENTPGGHSDLAGIEALLDELDTAESIGREKLERSRALVFAARRLADSEGDVDLSGVLILDDGMNPVEQSSKLAEVVQPAMQSADHIAYINHIREFAVTLAGYSLASWGLDHGGSADSGKALKLRQSRTLLTKSGKDRMARGAISEALSVALEIVVGSVVDVSVGLGDGTPEDTMERAQELTQLYSAGLVSTEEAVRQLHPEWDDEQVSTEAAALSAGTRRSRLQELLQTTETGES